MGILRVFLDRVDSDSPLWIEEGGVPPTRPPSQALSKALAPPVNNIDDDGCGSGSGGTDCGGGLGTTTIAGIALGVISLFKLWLLTKKSRHLPRRSADSMTRLRNSLCHLTLQRTIWQSTPQAMRDLARLHRIGVVSMCKFIRHNLLVAGSSVRFKQQPKKHNALNDAVHAVLIPPRDEGAGDVSLCIIFCF